MAGAYQLAAFRDAAAMAKTLNRTLILPKVWGWCDSDASPDVMADCTMAGSEMHAPWRAPGDLYFNMDVLEDGSHFLPWRVHSFLEHPRTPRTLRWSQTSLWLINDNEELPASFATGAVSHALWASELQALVGNEVARVLRVQNLQPGSFLGFDDADEARNDEFNGWWDRMTSDLAWCCLTRVEYLKVLGFDYVDFAKLAPLSKDRAARFEVCHAHVTHIQSAMQWGIRDRLWLAGAAIGVATLLQKRDDLERL